MQDAYLGLGADKTGGLEACPPMALAEPPDPDPSEPLSAA